MKLSLVFELLLIFVLLAFAASKSVKHRKNNKKGLQKDTETEVGQIEDSSINKYCKCIESYCNCCRDFALPLVNLNGPGCATLTYLSGDKMAVSLSFGKKVITNRTLSSKKPSPVCMPLPGGVSKFCGRVYNIARTGEDFRACLGLELQSKNTVEAAVRVSCFKFGSKGVTSEPADPLPLIPDEKGDDDDDDDDDDYDLGADDDDDDDDDDEESELDAVNDVESSDYTGFSLLGEDLLGDLFGSSGGKKSNKNKKKQAPFLTTTTTRRPRPTRRPARRPNTRTTTPRTTRTTTVRVRPVNRRPTRRPNTTRKPTTAYVKEISSSIFTTVSTTPTTPLLVPVTAKLQPQKEIQMTSVITDETFEPIVAHRVQSTTAKSVTNFEDPGLEMSLAHITGQLSSVPVLPLDSTRIDEKGSSKVEKEMAYEKVQMITPKPLVASDDNVNDDMVQIVQSLDSTEETVHDKETLGVEESRGYSFHYGPIQGGAYEGLSLPRKKQKDEFQLEDLDVLDLTHIGETIGDQLGIFGGKKRKNRHTIEKEPDYSDYHEVIDTMGDALLLARNNNENRNKKDRRRQNKMMRGEWSQA